MRRGNGTRNGRREGTSPYFDGQNCHSPRAKEQGWFPGPEKSQMTMGCRVQGLFVLPTLLKLRDDVSQCLLMAKGKEK